MSDARAKDLHKPSPEFWTIIGTLVAMGALILTVTGWLREDIRGLGAGLNVLQGEVNALAIGLNALRGEVNVLAVGLKALEVKVDKIDRRVDTIDRRVGTIDRRLAVVESHVLGLASADRDDEDG